MKTEKKRARPIDLQRMLSTRRGIMTLATVAAVVAGGILLVFLNAYRDGLVGGSDTKTVLVAKQLIPEGAPGEVIAADGMYQSATIDEDKVEDGAISNPDAIKDQYASKSIYPGEQLRPEDFQANADGLASRLSAYERAIAVPVDNYHGMVGELKAGDRVDVLAFYDLENVRRLGGVPAGQYAVTKTVLQDVLVLKAPEERVDGGEEMQEVILKMPSDRDVELVSHAADSGKVWLSLRPVAGAKSHGPGIATITRVLFGTKAQAFGVTKKQARKALLGR